MTMIETYHSESNVDGLLLVFLLLLDSLLLPTSAEELLFFLLDRRSLATELVLDLSGSFFMLPGVLAGHVLGQSHRVVLDRFRGLRIGCWFLPVRHGLLADPVLVDGTFQLLRLVLVRTPVTSSTSALLGFLAPASPRSTVVFTLSVTGRTTATPTELGVPITVSASTAVLAFVGRRRSRFVSGRDLAAAVAGFLWCGRRSRRSSYF
mmetsp:Transcript_24815/g.58887  ORF Transcript_24815/g.58887 Transcript_24815/m.58887 type:complete len:207 (-) Transcript_24815:359-979(-)